MAEEIVAERAQARWDALLQGDVATVYGFTSPAYRSGISQNRFRARFGGAVRWTKAEVHEVTCEEDRCRVVVLVSYRAARERMENTRPIEETWIHSEGEWWLHMK
jgi:hypothetical protein